MKIRDATTDDTQGIKDVYLQAFDQSEAGIVSELAIKLLKENHFAKTITLVAVENNEVAGHVAFSPVTFKSTNDYTGYILAPLAVSPKFQKNKIGSSLVKHGLEILSRLDAFIVFVYGDPQYYSRFGFNADLAKRFSPPHTLQYPEGWQALQLSSSVLLEGSEITCVDSLNDPTLW